MDSSKKYIFLVFILPVCALGQGENKYSADKLLEGIQRSEQRIHDMQAHCKHWELESNILFYDFNWGYERGKEYIESDNYRNGKVISRKHYTFDGDTQINFGHSIAAGSDSARICAFEPDLWHGYMTPKTLLGYTLNSWGQESLGSFLSKAEKLIVRKKTELINGRSCLVLEAIGLSVVDDRDNKFWSDILVWIDTERDFRPLKIEQYASYGEDRPYAGNERWHILQLRIDNIELRLIDAVWFPIQGDQQLFSIKEYLPPEGMTKEEFKNAYADAGLSNKEVREMLRPVIEPLSYKRRVAISDIKVNEGIDPNMFTVKFPLGCSVWDDFRKVGYVVKEGVPYGSISGKPLPELIEIGINLSPADVNNKSILVCFFDMEQRPSRNCILQLSTRAQELKTKDIVIVAVQASKTERAKLDEWVKENEINFPVGMIQADSEKVRFAWGVKSLPWLILTDKSHIVTVEGFNINELDAKIGN